MIVNVTGQGSPFFQSLDPSDNQTYTFAQDGSNTFVPVSDLSIGNGAGILTTNSNILSLQSNTIQTSWLTPQCGRFGIANSSGQFDINTYTGTGTTGNTVGFFPFNGNIIQINGIIYEFETPILANGNSCYVGGVPGQNVITPNTAGHYNCYYVFVFNSGANGLQLDFWQANTNGRSTSTTSGNIGVEILTGDDSRTLVGMCLTSQALISGPSSNIFCDANSPRWIASWFNRMPRGRQIGSTGGGPNNSQVWSAQVALDVIGWGDSLYLPAVWGQMDPSSTSDSMNMGLGYSTGYWNRDGVTSPNTVAESTCGPGTAAAWYSASLAFPSIFSAYDKGYSLGAGGQGDGAIGQAAWIFLGGNWDIILQQIIVS